jgi:hypothetical protein
MPRKVVLPVILAIAHVVPAAAQPATAQPCNPMIDGTYCAEHMSKKPRTTTSDHRWTPIQSIAGDLKPEQDKPATFGAITFGGGQRCVAFFRQHGCN